MMVKASLSPNIEQNSYSIRTRVSIRRDFFDSFNNNADGRFEEFFHLVPGGEITSDFQYVARHNSPGQRQLPALYATTGIVVSWPAKFYKLGFTVV